MMSEPIQPTLPPLASETASQPQHGTANNHPRHSQRRLLGPGIVAGAAVQDHGLDCHRDHGAGALSVDR